MARGACYLSWRNGFFLDQTLSYTGDTPASGYSADSVLNPLRWDFCRWPEADPWTLTWAAGSGETIPRDAIALIGNFHRSARRIVVQGSDDGSSWSTTGAIDTDASGMQRDDVLWGSTVAGTLSGDEVARPHDEGFLVWGLSGTGNQNRYLRIQVYRRGFYNGPLDVAMVWPMGFGASQVGSLRMESPPGAGSSVPRWDVDVEGLNLVSDTGHFLGSSVRRSVATGVLQWPALSAQWIREEWLSRSYQTGRWPVRDILQRDRVFPFILDFDASADNLQRESGVAVVNGTIRTTLQSARVGSISLPYRRI